MSSFWVFTAAPRFGFLLARLWSRLCYPLHHHHPPKMLVFLSIPPECLISPLPFPFHSIRLPLHSAPLTSSFQPIIPSHLGPLGVALRRSFASFGEIKIALKDKHSYRIGAITDSSDCDSSPPPARRWGAETEITMVEVSVEGTFFLEFHSIEAPTGSGVCVNI